MALWPFCSFLFRVYYLSTNLLCMSDLFCFFCHIGTDHNNLGPKQRLRGQANVWQVPHQPPYPPELHFCVKPFYISFPGTVSWTAHFWCLFPPGHKKVLPLIPRPCCHMCPLPPIPTNPPVPSLSLFPCRNLFTFLLCTLTLVFFALLFRLRSQISCLPEGPVAPLNLLQVSYRPPNPPPMHF